MYCPTIDDVTAAVLKLLPRGRAWQTNEGLPRPGREIGFAPSAFSDAFSTTHENPSILWQYWRAFAVVLQFLTQRLCDLRLEFWCQSVNETRDEWMTEYGLPDACDPFPDLCTKVAAIGGTRCEYYAEVAARSGWSIACAETIFSCGDHVGFSRAGRARAGATLNLATLKIIIFLNESPALANVGRGLTPFAGRLRAGRRIACGVDLEPLRCILARIVHAEILQVYEVNNAA
jgi:hypothetical protein